MHDKNLKKQIDCSLEQSNLKNKKCIIKPKNKHIPDEEDGRSQNLRRKIECSLE